jgi:hypothetical protein
VTGPRRRISRRAAGGSNRKPSSPTERPLITPQLKKARVRHVLLRGRHADSIISRARSFVWARGHRKHVGSLRGRLGYRSDPATMAVAKMIIEVAEEGERDPERLCAQALKQLSR